MSASAAASERVWLDGALVAVDEARISPFDHGLLVGDGVFETIRVYGGEPFAWTRHLDRLAHSASGLGLAVPDRADAARGGRARCSPANGHVEARLRITVTGGVAPLGSERGGGGPDGRRGQQRAQAVARLRARGRGAVGAQRPRRDRPD